MDHVVVSRAAVRSIGEMNTSADLSRPDRDGSSPPSRRRFVGLLAAAAAAFMAPLLPRRAYGQLPTAPLRPANHPDPRPGIDGSGVLTAEQLVNAQHVVELFDGIREIPHIADGILCYCGCAQIEGYRSLLICFEDPGMAQHCDICQGQGRLAHARWKEGQTLDQIRRATDARYGPGGVKHGKAHIQHVHRHT